MTRRPRCKTACITDGEVSRCTLEEGHGRDKPKPARGSQAIWHDLKPVDFVDADLDLVNCKHCRLQPQIRPGIRWPVVVCGCATIRRLIGVRWGSRRSWVRGLLEQIADWLVRP